MRALKPGKAKRCAQCLQKFEPVKPMQKFCGPLCAADYDKAERKKKTDNKAGKVIRLAGSKVAAKKQPATRQQRIDAAQQAFNAWVRERDYFEPCISCGSPYRDDWQAGHYRTVGANPELRFDPDNCHKQCGVCNERLDGNVAEYRRNLIGRIGMDRVELLEGPHKACHYTRDEIEDLISHYRAERRRLQTERERGGVNGIETKAAQG
ncbi:MAG: recombination protein NinG [Aeromonas veronii]